MGVVDEFESIMEVSNTLRGEEGCIWGHTQTFDSLKGYLLEESYEVLEAVDAGDAHNLLEELGDLFHLIIFFAKIAEKKGMFTLEDVFISLRKKLIYRHPHVFGGPKLDTVEAIQEQWRNLKKEEKAYRKTKFEGIPKTMPALARAQKMAEVMGKGEKSLAVVDKDTLGEMLFEIVYAAQQEGLNAELALHKELNRREQE